MSSILDAARDCSASSTNPQERSSPPVRSVRQTSERDQQQIELGLQLCNSSELDLQLLFSLCKTLGNG
jgi:hypothetical protein